MSFDPLSATAAGVTTSIKILEVTYLLKAVDEQTADLLKTTKLVDSNVNEARRLRLQKESLLNPGDRDWMDGIIATTEEALVEVQKLGEPIRVNTATTQSINLKNRILWVFRDSPKVRDKHNHLSSCHQALIGVITMLHSKDFVVVAPLPAVATEQPPPAYTPEYQDFFNWRDQRRRKSSTDLKDVASIRSAPLPDTRTSNLSPQSPDLNWSSAQQSSRPLPSQRSASAFPTQNSMIAPPAPPLLHSSSDGSDGLQVLSSADDYSSFSPPTLPPFGWTPVNLAQPSPWQAGTSSTQYGSIHASNRSIAPSASNIQSPQMPVGPQSATQSQPWISRGHSTTKGREWLASYAVRSDIGHRQTSARNPY